MKPLHTQLVKIALTATFISVHDGTSSVSAAEKKEQKQRVEPQFRHLYKTFGKNSNTRIHLTTGPKEVKMRNGGVPGKCWLAESGRYKFKLTIQDGVDVTVEQLIERLQKLPMPYMRACEVVSDEKEDGIAIYKTLGGAGAHGGKQYVNMTPGVKAIIIAHEMGHTLEQKAREADETIFEQWQSAIDADKISVSGYGDGALWEDLADFAKVYAACMDAGKEELNKLRKLAPARYTLWKRILEGN
ncbi:MAG: hypothetical protein QGH15_00130 [Kiritimatiellia bacterium]|jgi:hypothetical protein|nr:hypothetical protein [Kiritimatiellia bacterium]